MQLNYWVAVTSPMVQNSRFDLDPISFSLPNCPMRLSKSIVMSMVDTGFNRDIPFCHDALRDQKMAPSEFSKSTSRVQCTLMYNNPR